MTKSGNMDGWLVTGNVANDWEWQGLGIWVMIGNMDGWLVTENVANDREYG